MEQNYISIEAIQNISNGQPTLTQNKYFPALNHKQQHDYHYINNLDHAKS